jgi:PAS domain S-box-containing protein
VLDTSSDAVIRFDPGGPIKYVNRQVERISGVPHERWMGRTLAEMGYVDFAHSWDAKSRQGFDTGEALAFGFEEDLRLAVSSRLAIEARTRWHHPDEQVWAAERFIEVA